MRDMTQEAATRDTGTAPWIEVLSGLGEKGPACIRLWTGSKLWILDVGFGPEATAPFRPEWLIGADAVFISHDHIDHIGGAGDVIEAGLPIWTTAQTARALPPGAQVNLLPETGEIEIDGTRILTGRNGHALGGIWLQFLLGDGFFYSGDWSEESTWFAFDTPSLPARTALIDCSYHRDGLPQKRRTQAMDALIDSFDPCVQLMFPVPPSGRAGELALHLLRRGQSVSLDPVCQAALRAALASGGVSPKAQELAQLIDKPFDPTARFLLCDTPNADGGMAWQVIQDWRDSGRLGGAARVVFTGHMTSHARAIAAHGGHFLRWNVHPPLGDQIGMIRRLGARRYAPLFCTCPEDYLLEPGFDAEPVFNGRIWL